MEGGEHQWGVGDEELEAGVFGIEVAGLFGGGGEGVWV